MWDSHLPGVSRNVGFVPVKRDGRCARTGLDGVIIRTTPLLWAALFKFFIYGCKSLQLAHVVSSE